MIALHVAYAITAPLTGTRRQRIAREPSPRHRAASLELASAMHNVRGGHHARWLIAT
jgi:hypothetical protein